MAYDPDNVFAKILREELPSTRVYQDDEFIAFRDINPAAKLHVLVIPRHHQVEGPADLVSEDAEWVGRMVVVATRVAADLGLAADGYRLVMNQGADGGQQVPHVHLHILGGERLGAFV